MSPGSSAGAGSGDFHVYRAIRRKELARQKQLDDDLLREKARVAHEAEREERLRKEEERTAKNRAKRMKKKSRQHARKDASPEGQSTEDGLPADQAAARGSDDGDEGDGHTSTASGLKRASDEVQVGECSVKKAKMGQPMPRPSGYGTDGAASPAKGVPLSDAVAALSATPSDNAFTLAKKRQPTVKIIEDDEIP